MEFFIILFHVQSILQFPRTLTYNVYAMDMGSIHFGSINCNVNGSAKENLCKYDICYRQFPLFNFNFYGQLLFLSSSAFLLSLLDSLIIFHIAFVLIFVFRCASNIPLFLFIFFLPRCSNWKIMNFHFLNQHETRNTA